jgi:hypothetical protein
VKLKCISVKVAALQALPEPFVLLLSIISLFIGPMLYLWLRKGGFVAKAFDSVIVVVLIVLMAFLLIPESWAELGYWSVAMMFAGYLLPGLLESLIKKAAHTLHLISLMLALAGLALHAMLDGAALLIGNGDAGNNLGLAIVLHRFGVGLMLWMMVQPVFGKRVAFGVLGFVGLATVVGYLLSETILGLEGDHAMSMLQALIIGMIVHSLIHRSHGESHHH